MRDCACAKAQAPYMEDSTAMVNGCKDDLVSINESTCKLKFLSCPLNRGTMPNSG